MYNEYYYIYTAVCPKHMCAQEGRCVAGFLFKIQGRCGAALSV